MQGKFLAEGEQTGSNQFLLILQTAKPPTTKKSHGQQDSLNFNLLLHKFDNVYQGEGHKELDINVSLRLNQFNLKIMMTVTNLGFSTLSNLTQVATLAPSVGLFLMLSQHVVYIKISVCPSGIF